MAGTPYGDIFDLFLIQVKDWKLIELYQSSPTDFATYLEGFLVSSIPDFEDICSQSLAKNDATQLFDETLTFVNQRMLASLMVKYWMMKEVRDILQMSLHILDKEFKVFSESANLMAKKSHLIEVEEKLSQMLQDYAYKNNDWDSWIVSGAFGGYA